MSFSPDAWKRIGVLFQAGRHLTGMSAETFADRAGMSTKAVYNAESGDPHRGVPPTFAKYAAALGWTAESVRAVLDGGEPALADPSEAPVASPEEAPANLPGEATLLHLSMRVSEFGRLAVSLGADGRIRDELDATAQRLVESISTNATEEKQTSGSKRHQAEDRELTLRAMEDDERNR